ncbi:MAG: response regulator transcription factor [Phaeodactylibacter sp.]|nr:response regulator transcription factor [Phaeodactylibacter sp.]
MMKPTLLFIDDCEVMCHFLVQYFDSHYRAQAFQSAANAWRWLDAGNFPDLIILDLKMPEVSGAEMLSQLKYSALFCDIPVIILSSIDNSQERVRCLYAGAADYLVKPFNPKELEYKIQFHIRLSKAQ